MGINNKYSYRMLAFVVVIQVLQETNYRTDLSVRRDILYKIFAEDKREGTGTDKENFQTMMHF